MTAQEKILAKALATTGLSSAEIDLVRAGVKDRAFISARIESVRTLQTMQQNVADWLGSVKRDDGALTTRASAISAIMASAKREGIATGTGKVSDPGSVARAQVVVDTNVDLARGYVGYVAGASTGARMAFPSVELIRGEERQAKRDWVSRWKAAGGQLYGGRMICLKGSPVLTSLSRFGVPYAPFDYGSGMVLDEVDYDTCIELGVITESYKPEGDIVQDFNATLEADMEFKGADDPGFKFLKDSFGDQIKYKDGKIQWQADIIQEALKNPTDIRFGKSSHPDAPNLNLTMPKGNVIHELKKHIGSAEKDPRDTSLTEKEVALIPHVWRNPDRIIKDAETGAWYYEMDAVDGGIYRLIVDIYPDAARMRTFFKKRSA